MGGKAEEAGVACDKVAVKGCLDKAHDQVPVLVEHAHAVKEYGKRHVLVKVGYFVTTYDTDKDADNRKGRKHDNRCDQARRKQELVGA